MQSPNYTKMFNLVHEFEIIEKLHRIFLYNLGNELNTYKKFEDDIEEIKSLGIALHIELKLRDRIK